MLKITDGKKIEIRRDAGAQQKPGLSVGRGKEQNRLLEAI